jgi:antitoxin component of MazEF toxin-antitoxin module
MDKEERMPLRNRKVGQYAPPPLIKNITPIGNSKGIILPQSVLEQLGLEKGGQVELRIDGKSLLVVPIPHRYATDAEFNAVKKRVFAEHHELNERLAKR